MSLYDDLGVSPDATEAEIAAAYRKAARRHHPDAGGSAADFERIQKAASILRDAAKRAEYNRTGQTEDMGPSLLAQATDLLCSLFSEVITRCEDFGAIDVVKTVRKALRHQLDQAREQRGQIVTRRAQLDAARDRLAYKGEQTDVLSNMIAAQLRTLDGKLIDADRTIAYIERAVEMAEDYTWRAGPDADAAIRGLQLESIAWDELVR